MGIKLFHLPAHRVFNYTPTYYDPEKEKLEHGVAKRDAEGNYVPGSIVSKGFRKRAGTGVKRKDGGYSKTRRIAVYLMIAAILVALFYFSKAFSSLIEAMKVPVN